MSGQRPHTNVRMILRWPSDTMGCARGAYVLAVPKCSGYRCVQGPGLDPFSWVTGQFASASRKCIDLN